MEVIQQIKPFRDRLKQMRVTDGGQALKVGFVPTMGYLHQGHMSLIAQAKQECDIVVLSIFVNPLQFGPNEDLDNYPRNIERDITLAEQSHVDLVFLPERSEMYPQPMHTKVIVSGASESLCGASRPGHFDGVATVVSKLLHIVNPDRIYFGLKDAQQIAVIQQMVMDLNIDVEVIACETLREPDGLAMSSRNVNLSVEERNQAVVLSQALENASQLIKEDKELTIGQLLDVTQKVIQEKQLALVDYIELRTYPSLQSCNRDERVSDCLQRSRTLILALAVKFGNTRLIDNRMFKEN